LHDKGRKVISHIPIQFEKLEQLDDRFLKVKIWMLNIGRNYNGSVFTKDAVLKALPSVSLTPILGYIESNESNDNDFSDHRIVLEVDDEKGYKMKYLGSAYGVIPQDPNAKFELRENEFGGLEEYLTIEGILWTKFDDAINIMERDTVKFHSMELAEQYDGYMNDDGYFVFTDFKFFGCCILGKNVEPAIPKSTIEKMFTTEKVTSIINDKLTEYKEKFEKKEENNVNYESLMKEFNVTSEMLEKAGITDVKKFNLDEFKEELRKIVEDAKKQLDDRSGSEGSNQDNNQNPNADNPLEQNQDGKEDFEKGGEGNADRQSATADNLQTQSKKDQKENQSMVEKNSEGNEIEEFKKQLNEIKKDYATIKQEHDKLVEYKKKKEEEEHLRAVQEVVNKFETLTKDDVKEVVDNALSFTVTEVEEKLYAILGRKQAQEESSSTTKTGFAKYLFNNRTQDGEPTPSYEYIFKKHLKN
jgi:hypothetical protein